ncbi:hypothetical protein AOLI_G00008730 [Acnodon oligacanthus]
MNFILTFFAVSGLRMSQWERLKQLDSVCLQRVDELYCREELPMAVRDYLAQWIEDQDWEGASRDTSRAVVLFQVLLENLDNQYSRFVQERSFLMQRNFRRFKQNFQKYQEDPCTLAEIINWFLTSEREILQAAELAQKVQMLQVQQNSMESESQRHIEKNGREFKNKIQVMEHSLRCLEEQQDEFDFKYQTHRMDGTTDEAEKKEQIKVLQVMLNMLNVSRTTFLTEMSSLLDSAASLLASLIEELEEWKRRQQVSCIGAPEDINLEPLEKWFTQVGEGMFQLRKFLEKLQELHDKMTYEADPIKDQKPSLQVRVDDLLTALLKSAFIVETQPSMPQGRGPLVLRTNVQFSLKTRLLFKVPELNHSMKVTVSIDKDPPKVKWYRKFNVLGTSSKALNMAESMNGGMVADFRHLTLKEQKAGAGGKGMSDLSLSVTEELHTLHCDTQFELHGLSVTLEASSLPVIVISNSSQQQSAWASVLWFNTLCTEPKNLMFFASSPVASWSQLAQMLSWQFLSCGKRGLEQDQLETLAHKLFGSQQNYDNCKISWTKFSKENVSGTSFTLWVWLDGILNLVKMYLADLWHDGSIMGFVSKGKEKVLLKKKQSGTFLLRFSESCRDGGITFSWVEYSNNGEPNVRTVQPFTSTDLKQIPLAEILRNFQIMEAENAPIYPLQFLYPNTPKAQAFGKYYNEKTGEESPYFKYIKTKLVFVSKENGCTNVAEGPMPDLCMQHNDLSPELNQDIMLQEPENSPMYNCTSDPILPNGVLESSLSCPQEEFSGALRCDQSLHDFPEGPLRSVPSDESLMGIIPDAFSPDVDIPGLFFNDPNVLEGYSAPLDHSFQELVYPRPLESAEVFIPEMVESHLGDENSETYRFLCPYAGQFQCKLTNLVFDMKGEGEVLYKIISWDVGLLDGLGQMQPAGPLYDIDCTQGLVSYLHLPHCEILHEKNPVEQSVAHFTGDNIEIMPPVRVTDTHAVISIQSLSLFGLLKNMILEASPISAQVLLFHKEMPGRKKLHIHLLPVNVPVEEVGRKHKGSIYFETSSACQLTPGRKYKLSCDPYVSQPKVGRFDYDYGPNYHPTFVVFLHADYITVSLMDEVGTEVWEPHDIFLTIKKACETSHSTEATLHGVDTVTEFIDKHREQLIQRVSSVLEIADCLKSKNMISDEDYSNVQARETSQDKMRIIYTVIQSRGRAVKAEFYECLKEKHPYLVDDLESGSSNT